AAVGGIRTEQAGTRCVNSPSPHACNTRQTPLTVYAVSQSTDARIVRRVQRLGAGPLLVTATSRRAASPRPACSISTSSSRTASTSSQYPPAVPTLLVGDQTRTAF